ncbi:hypothetical protein P3S68_013041 [Capsicum galapagoense]
MKHLPVHLPYEARVAGPVQHRWMYPFKRYLETLKKMIGNKTSVEGFICEAYLMMESTQLFSHYFEPHVMPRNHNVDRNDDGGVVEDLKGNLSIFSHLGRLWGEAKKRDLILDEIKAAQTYILLNCEEVEPFVSIKFCYMARCNPIENEYLRSLARGLLIGATSHSVYFVNGYKFHTECHGSMRSIMNSGVCISDPNFGDYYGRIKEIIQVEYREASLKQIVLFKCELFDPIIDVGVKKHDRYKLVDINHRRRYKKYEPFILAMQATQVCYVPYPSKKKDKEDCVPFQVEEVEVHEIDMSVSVDEDILFHDPNGGVLEMNKPLNDDLFEEHHEIQDGCTEEECKTEETEEEDEEEQFEEDIVNMIRGGYRAGKSTVRSKAANRAKTPSIPAPVIEQDDTSSIPTMPPNQTPVIPETSPVSPNQSSLTGQNMNAQSNTAAEATSSQRNISVQEIPVLEPSSKCSSSITLSFKSEVDLNGINWKGVSQDVKDGYFGEFKKNFYWDASNYCGGHEVTSGTHTSCSITAGEHRKKLLWALKISRDSIPSELHLHVHTHNHDGKSFVGERSRLLHERYEEIIREKVQCESEIDQLETYYETAGGAKKKRLFGLGSEATSYFGKKLCACNASTSSVPPSISLPTTNMEELVKQLIPALTTHFLPIVIERVGGTRVQDGVVLDPPPTHDDDDDVDL